MNFHLISDAEESEESQLQSTLEIEEETTGLRRSKRIRGVYSLGVYFVLPISLRESIRCALSCNIRDLDIKASFFSDQEGVR